MPVAEFEGRFGWGYDGVDLYRAVAPVRRRPTTSAASSTRRTRPASASSSTSSTTISGRSGNYLRAFAPAYFTDRYENEWGDAINFDGPDAGPVREFFVANAGYWIDEFHLDGLRLDATQQIHDRSDEHVLAAIGRRARAAAAGRSIVIVAENEPQDTRLVRPIDGGRLRPRRALERRLSSQRDGGADRPGRGVLQRHARRAAGVHLGREVRLSVSGPAVPLAARAARHAGVGTAAVRVRRVPRRTTIRSRTRRAACAATS